MFEVGDLIRECGTEAPIWRVVEFSQDRVYPLAKCDDKPGVTRVILRPEQYEKVEATP